eukprot:2668806-Rhodomonas_salina.1
MDPIVASKVAEGMARLRKSPDADAVVVEGLQKWILGSDLVTRLRINTHTVAASLMIPVDIVTAHCVLAAHLGVLDMVWASHCQH